MFGFPSAEPQYNTGVTVELRELVESGVNIWDFEYPSFYEGTAKSEFEKKVIDHYYFRQIGQETTGRFLHCFRTKIKEIMPYYVNLYKTVLMFDEVKDPFENVDMVEERTQTRTMTGSNTSTSELSKNLRNSNESMSDSRFSDTPGGDVGNLANGYITNATVNNGTITDTGSETGNQSVSGSSEGSETLTDRFTRKGNHGVDTFAKVLKEHRSAIINIDMMIIEELGDLFLKVY